MRSALPQMGRACPCSWLRRVISTRRAHSPGQLPVEWERWPRIVQDSIKRQRQPGRWYLLFKGVAA